MTEHSGHCLCGAVSFTSTDVEAKHHACHCEMCRRWAGSPLLATSAAGVVFAGDENIGIYDSSEWAERGFCKICGSNLFYRLKATGGYHMPVGVFDDQSVFGLQVRFSSTANRPAMILPETIPALPRQRQW